MSHEPPFDYEKSSKSGQAIADAIFSHYRTCSAFASRLMVEVKTHDSKVIFELEVKGDAKGRTRIFVQKLGLAYADAIFLPDGQCQVYVPGRNLLAKAPIVELLQCVFPEAEPKDARCYLLNQYFLKGPLPPTRFYIDFMPSWLLLNDEALSVGGMVKYASNHSVQSYCWWYSKDQKVMDAAMFEEDTLYDGGMIRPRRITLPGVAPSIEQFKIIVESFTPYPDLPDSKFTFQMVGSPAEGSIQDIVAALSR